MFLVLLVFTLILSCREEIELETENFENVLVVEATITNELKFQEINLSRTVQLEQDTPAFENNASVKVIDNQFNEFNFTQNNDGVYISDIEFKAEENTDYKLEIITESGKMYESSTTTMTPNANIENLYAELNADGDEIEVLIDSNDDNNLAQYFRYEYEETYKIIAPYYNPVEASISYVTDIPTFSYLLELTLREEQEEICYKTIISDKILLTSTTELNDNVVSRFPIKSIDINDPVLINRYSILVKQITQNLESHLYYKTLRDLGSNGSILSESQPGFVIGNIHSSNNLREKVIGFFEVASVTSKRIYFNHSDFGLLWPDYYITCYEEILDYNDNMDTPIDGDRNDRKWLYWFITRYNFQIYQNPSEDKYILVPPECGDCTTLGTNVIPEFWED